MSVPFTADDGIAKRAALGLIVLQSDETLEPELRSVFVDDDVALYHSRIPNDNEVTPDTLHDMGNELPYSLRLLPPASKLDVVAYACTSASTIIGPSKVSAMINAVHPAAATTNPITAVIEACRHLGIHRLGLLTPYTAEVSAAMRELLELEGLAITEFASFEQSQDPVVARISPRSVLHAVEQIGQRDTVDAVFASCTNLRTFSILDAAETSIDKPVISSNSALAWHMRRLSGLGPVESGPGRLLRAKT